MGDPLDRLEQEYHERAEALAVAQVRFAFSCQKFGRQCARVAAQFSALAEALRDVDGDIDREFAGIADGLEDDVLRGLASEQRRPRVSAMHREYARRQRARRRRG